MNIKKELLESCRKEDRRAQFELYRLCYSILLSVCLRYEKNKEDAEFLLNKAFYKILKNLDKYNDHIPFEAWIRRITINTVIDDYRKNKKEKIDYVEEPLQVAPVSSMDFNTADQKFDAEELQMLIDQLPPVSKKVFNLYVIDGYNHKEIADQLEMSEGTSKWHLSSARKKLKELIIKLMNNVAVLL
jgi:RNA polymerase sigma-70 factor (ECF subfamily)